MELLKQCIPDNIQKFVGNRFLVRKIYENVSKGMHVVIFGPTGCGKTTLCRIFQSSIGYKSVFEVNKDTYSSAKELVNNLKNFMTSKTIECFFNSNRNNKRAIFIDDYDILINTDKTLTSLLNSEIFPLLEKYKIQLVVTAITDHNIKKKFQETLKNIEYMKLSYPLPKEGFVYLINELGDKIDGKEERLLELLTKYKGCIRDAMLHLEEPDDTAVLGLSFKDMNQFETIKAIFTKSNITKEDIMYILHNDVSNIAYLLYENIPEEICYNRIMDNPTTIYNEVLNAFSATAEIETYAFNTTEWKLYDMANLIRMGIIQRILNTYHSKPAASRKDGALRFTQLLSKMSHKNILCKKIDTIRDKTLLNYEQIFKSIETSKETFKKNSEEANVHATYMKYFSEDK